MTVIWRVQGVSPPSLLLCGTYAGDANLDGIVNAMDFNTFETTLAAVGTYGRRTISTATSVTNICDFGLMAHNFSFAIDPLPTLASFVPVPIDLLPVVVAAIASGGDIAVGQRDLERATLGPFRKLL